PLPLPPPSFTLFPYTTLFRSALRSENAQLRRLLEARERLPRESTLAEILYQGRDPFSRKVIIDKGRQQGIRPGQAVIDDIGVIGDRKSTRLNSSHDQISYAVF